MEVNIQGLSSNPENDLATQARHIHVQHAKHVLFNVHVHVYICTLYKVTCKGVRRRGFLSRLPGLCPVELEGLLVPFSSGILSPSYTQYNTNVSHINTYILHTAFSSTCMYIHVE